MHRQEVFSGRIRIARRPKFRPNTFIFETKNTTNPRQTIMVPLHMHHGPAPVIYRCLGSAMHPQEVFSGRIRIGRRPKFRLNTPIFEVKNAINPQQTITEPTPMYYQPRYDKNGNNLNPDGNITTSTVSCSTCYRQWVTATQYGKTEYTELK